MTRHSGSDFEHLAGRSAERVVVENLLTALPDGGAGLAWAGHRGYGRSVVLGAAQTLAAAAGFGTLEVSGAMIADQAGGLLDKVLTLAGTPSAVRPSAPSPTDRSRPGLLLHHLGEVTTTSGPVVLCLDDVDLLHPDDLASVAFTARRLARMPVLLLATTGPALTVRLERTGVPVRPLLSLTRAEAEQVLAARHGDMDPEVAELIMAAAAGSPLALVELPAALTSRQRGGLDTAPTPLHLTDRLREVYAAPLDSLGRPAHDVLALAAVAGAESVLSLLDTDRSIIDPAAFDELERSGLFGTFRGGTRLDFGHPLVRVAMHDRLDPTDVARAQDLLTHSLSRNPDARAGQWAEIWAQPDGALASRLERSARRATRRGELGLAVATMIRAAHLSPDSQVRSRRLLEAAHLRATVTGEMDAAAEALAEAARADSSSALGLRAAATSGQLMMSAEAPLAEVSRLVIDALASSDPHDPTYDSAAAQACLQLLFYVSLMSADAERWRVFDRLMGRHKDLGPVVGLLADVLPDIARTTPVTLERLDAAILGLTDTVNPAEVIGISIAAYHLDRLEPCRAALVRVVDDARRGEMVGIGAEAMIRLALDDCQTGQLPRAARLAAEGLELATRLGRHEPFWTFQLCLALIAALQGDLLQVDTLTAQMSAWAAPRGAALIDHHCAHLRGLAALGRGDFETAYAHGISINQPGTLAGHTTVTFAACLDLVEAAVHSHRAREASAHADALVDSGIGDLSPRFALRVATACAMTAPDSRAPDLFDQALALSQTDRWPFDLARTQLAYGTRLRRLHLATGAQHQLSASFETFRRLGARGWAQRAAEEMRAAGLPMPPGQRIARAPLTGRDLEIATLAAAGLSNQEIGAQLFLSPRTVGSRLYRIFPQLGVSSRAGLSDALDEQGPAGGLR